MAVGSIVENNKTQAVLFPEETRFPENVKKVTVRRVGPDRILSPVDQTWDTFFLSPDRLTDDFMADRAPQEQSERDEF